MTIWCALVALFQVCYSYIRVSYFFFGTSRATIIAFAFTVLFQVINIFSSIFIVLKYKKFLYHHNDEQRRESIVTHPLASKANSISCLLGGTCSLLIGVFTIIFFYGIYGSPNCYLGICTLTVGALGMFAQRCHNLPALDLIIMFICRFGILIAITNMGFATYYFHFIFTFHGLEYLIVGNLVAYLFTMAFSIFNLICTTLMCYSASSENRTVGLLTITLRSPAVSTIAKVGYFSGIGQFICSASIFACTIAACVIWRGDTFASLALIAAILVLLSAQLGNHLALDQSEDFIFIYFMSNISGSVCCVNAFGLAIYEIVALQLSHYNHNVFILFIFIILILAVAIALHLNSFVITGRELKIFSGRVSNYRGQLLNNNDNDNDSNESSESGLAPNTAVNA
ncbi:uncharacterized protein TRIADDRAFT_57393 [Trichoplax adhaerens]|uniref:Uncharacterized protein n=1 Tax=Trichoplax adhaerens TaxID=10228 RepID=B3RZB6_TRIAD|nr:predicted protein [Trichoplax adhaerens]EDV23814.1 predicted protein [Trichoplax adhaerens]|eukprot:XP_002113340.1 predicted protein [Trichoplax adhaerens]